MKNTLWQRFLCLVLTGAMLFGMVPAQAFAQEHENGTQQQMPVAELVPEETKPQTVDTVQKQETPERTEETLPPIYLTDPPEIPTVSVVETEPEQAEPLFTEPTEPEIVEEAVEEPAEEPLPAPVEQNTPASRSLALSRAATTSGDFTYELLDDGTCRITDYSGTATNLIIPEAIDGYTVTQIGSSAFQDCDTLEEVELPESLTSLGYHAFYGCDSLTKAVVNGTDLVLDQNAFYYCTVLAELVIGDGVVEIGAEEFNNNYGYYDSLTTVTFGSGLTAIGEGAFYGCNGLVTLELPAGVTEVKRYTFYNCDALEKVVLSDTTVAIGEYAFDDCDSLVNLDLGGVQTIDQCAFQDCDGLTEVELPESLTSLGYHAFYGCDSLTKAVVNGTDLVLDQDAFYCCTALTELVIGDGVVEIGAEEFNNNYGYYDSLTTVTFGSGLTTIGEKAFYGCNGLVTLELPAGVTEIEQYTFSGCDALETVIFPDTAITVSDYAFSNCDKLKTIEFGGVTTINQCAFQDCDTLEEVELPDSLTSLGYHAFYGCDSLTKAVVNGTDLVLDQKAFYYCTALTELVIGDGVVEIGEGEFYNNYNYFSNLTTLTLGDGLTTIGAEAFYNLDTLTTLEIPASVTEIGDSAFRSWDALETVTFAGSKASIGDYAFYYCKNLKNLDLGNGVTSIGQYAFQECEALTELNLPESLTAIGNYAFYYCDSITSVVINGSLESVGDGVFRYCSALNTVTLGDNVKTLGSNAFYNVDNLTTVNLGSGLTVIGDSAFYDCDGLTELNLPESLTTIGDSAFYDCDGLTELVLPESLTTIGDSAFYDCDLPTTLELPEKLTTIGESAFYDCDGLTDLVIGAPLTSVGSGVFSKCSKLANVTIQDGVNTLGESMFRYCPFTEIVVPDSVTTIGAHAFESCDELLSITLPAGLTTLSDYVLSRCDKLETIEIPEAVTSIGSHAFYYCQSLSQVTIPDGVTEVGDHAFAYCYALTTMALPEDLTTIGAYAFYGCYTMTGVELPESLTGLGEYAFDNCDGLTEIVIPAGVPTIGNYTFYDCDNLTEVTLPDGLISIGYNAFCNCAGMVNVNLPESLVSIGESAFCNCDGLTEITVPSGITSLAGGTFEGCDYLTTVNLPEGLTEIGDGAFYSCDMLTSVNLPEHLVTVGDIAFAYCDGLVEIDLPERLTGIGNYAFEDCYGLTQILLPDTLINLGNGVFSGCDSLTEITIPARITAIPEFAFYDCDNLVAVNLPDTLTSIGYGAFYSCECLANIVLPEGLTYLGIGVFSDCDSLTEITIPAEITAIPESAFQDCDNLVTVNLSGTLTSIGNGAFYSCDSLAQIELPDSVEYIDSYAFWGCESLADIVIPANVTTINYGAFYGCTNLVSATIYNGVEYIEYNAFYNCPNLTIFAFPGSYAWNYAEENAIPVLSMDDGLNVLQLSVKDDQGTSVREGYTVNWYLSGEDTPIATGNLLRGLEEGSYEYELILDEALYFDYIQPQRGTVDYQGGMITVDLILESIGHVWVSGIITDPDGDPIEDAKLSFTQTSGTAEKTYTAYTDAYGSYGLDMAKLAAVGTLTANGYYSRDLSLNLTSGRETYEFNATLNPLPSNKVTLKLFFKETGADSFESLSYDSVKLDFLVENLTQGTQVTDYEFQNGNLVISAGSASANDVLRITAIDSEGKMQAEAVEVELDEQKNGSAEIDFLENGKFTITELTGCENKLLMLFDADGAFLSADNASSGYTSEALAAGAYSIVLIQKTSMLRSVAKLENLTDYGLTAGTDYVLETVTIQNGELKKIDSIFVPVLDLTKLYYTVEDNTGFTVNKSLAFAGEYIVLRVAYEIDEKFDSAGEQIRIYLSDELSMAGGSLTVDSKKHIYSLEDNVLTVNTNQSKGVVRFYVSPASVGNYQILSELSFTSGTDKLTQPLGSVNVDVVAAQMNLPEKTCGGKVTVTGKAVPNSTITFYDTGVEIGTATSNGAGNFNAELSLDLAGKYTYHDITATVANEKFAEPLAVEGQTVINDESFAQVSKVTMINTGDNGENVSVFDMINPGPAPSYRFWPGRYPDFTFIVEFVGNGASKVENVSVVTTSNSGDQTAVACTYDEATDRWIGTAKFNTTDSAPAGVAAYYDMITEEIGEDQVPELDTDLIKDYVDRLEVDTDLGEFPSLDDPDSFQDGVEDGKTLDELIVEMDALLVEMEKIQNEIYYIEQTAWAEKGVVYEVKDNLTSFECNGEMIEFASDLLVDVTMDGLLADGYTIQSSGEGITVLERASGDGSMDMITWVNSENGDEITQITTKFSKATARSVGEVAGATALDAQMWADIGYAGFSDKNTKAINAEIGRLDAKMQDYKATAKDYCKRMVKQQIVDPEFDPLYKQFYQEKYNEYTNKWKNLDQKIGGLNKKLGWFKAGGGILGGIGIGMTIGKFRELNIKLDEQAARLPKPEACTNDAAKLSYLEKRVDFIRNLLRIAETSCVVNGTLTVMLGFTGIGLGASIAVSVGTSAMQNMYINDIEHKLKDFEAGIDSLKCGEDDEPDSDHGNQGGDNGGNGGGNGKSGQNSTSSQPANTIVDPSGYVYEAVPSNRIEGVKAEAYYLAEAVDEWGIPTGEMEEVLWDAENYDQVNPFYTDSTGMFHWDVPLGQWLVKFSKEGYYDTDSRNDPAVDEDGYLPVPPPQVEVNTAIVSKAAPTVESINIYDDQVQIIFSQYMDLDSVNEDNVTVTCAGEAVEGTLVPVNAEYNYEQTVQYASVFAFTPDQKLDDSADVQIENCVNYAGTAMTGPFAASGKVTYRPESLDAGQNNQIIWNESGELTVQVLPAKAGADQTISVQVISSSILAAAAQTVTTDSEGKATLTLTGLLPGSSDVILKLEGTDITSTVNVAVVEKAPEIEVCEKVTANLPTGSVVEPGTELILSTATEGAEIYYTLDGTCPCVVDSTSRILYTGPIALYEDTFLIAYAVKEGIEDSATSGFVYTIKCAHAETKLVNEKAATCTETGYTGDELCVACEEIVVTGTEIAAKGHTELIDAAVAATCTATGLTEGKHCSVCKAVLVAQKVVPVKGHTEVTDKAVAATCTATGLTEGKHCSVCNTVLVKQEAVPATGHSFGKWIETIPATSVSGGEEKRTCENCGTEEKRSTDKLVNPFSDVAAGAYYEVPVLWAVAKNVTSGIGNGMFGPNRSCLRSQVVTFLWRAAGQPEPKSANNPFVDVKTTDYFYKAVLWAVEEGITTGMDATHFGFNKECTRAQVATFLWRAQGKPAASGSNPFNDVKNGEYYYDAVIWAVENGVTTGTSATTFSPNATCTRGQIVTFLYRALK